MLTYHRANLARAGFSVFLIEAGGDKGDTYLQSVPAWYGFLVYQEERKKEGVLTWSQGRPSFGGIRSQLAFLRQPLSKRDPGSKGQQVHL